jgi:hypothetical protein
VPLFALSGREPIFEPIAVRCFAPTAALALDPAGRAQDLPKYSPDFNPIEMAYSKFKERLRSAEARTVAEVWLAIRSFLPSLSPQKCANYLRHAGYVSK